MSNDTDDFLQSLFNSFGPDTTTTERSGDHDIAPDNTDLKTVPCPNCETDLDAKLVKNKASVNVGRPYIFCEQCSEKEMLCFWFLDWGLCECGCPMYQAKAKKGKNAGRLFEACSANCPGKFRWL